MSNRLRRKVMALPVALGLVFTSGCQTLAPDPCPSSLTGSYISEGLRELLFLAMERIIGQLGRTDGFYGDGSVRVPLPETLQRTRSVVQALGGAGTLADLELSLNRAAEDTVPRARGTLENAIARLQFQDPESVFRAGERSASRYFREQAVRPISLELQPVVEQSLANAGAFRAFDDLTTRYVGIALPRQFQSEMIGHVLQEALEAIFDYMAREESIIRSDPALRSQRLQCLFSRLT
ncbi:MAG: DUF4197 domain-containing protein [Alphaproteobacteria bacterium]|nr:DUF4197 domain-containing protein [Alphaproteobacteria bacterium]